MSRQKLKVMLDDIHREAESHRWVKHMFSPKITLEQYAMYLVNQLRCYEALESRCYMCNDMLKDIPEIKRSIPISHDLMHPDIPKGKVMPSVNEYAKRVMLLNEDQLWAHIYVRHFGDMYGGEMIGKAMSKHMPEISTEYYEFERKNNMIEYVSAKLHETHEKEARKVFQDAINLYEDLANYYAI
jgi:heme oxygenase